MNRIRILLVAACGLVAATAVTIFALGLYLSSPGRAQPTVSGPVASTASVGSSASGQVIAANPTRRGITFYNQSAVVISIRPGTTAAVASGGGTINLAASGGTISLVCSPSLPCGAAWQAIAASSSGNTLTIWEF